MFEGATIRPRGAPLFAHLPPDRQDRARAALAASLDRAGQHRLSLPPWRFAAYVAAAIRSALHGPPPSYNQRLAYRMWKKRRSPADDRGVRRPEPHRIGN